MTNKNFLKSVVGDKLKEEAVNILEKVGKEDGVGVGN